jgi:hypothetical protein
MFEVRRSKFGKKNSSPAKTQSAQRAQRKNFATYVFFAVAPSNFERFYAAYRSLSSRAWRPFDYTQDMRGAKTPKRSRLTACGSLTYETDCSNTLFE